MPDTTTIEPTEVPTGARTGHRLPTLAALVEATTAAREQAAPLVEEVAYVAERVDALLDRYQEIRRPVVRLEAAAREELMAAVRTGLDVGTRDAISSVAMAIADDGLWTALDDIRERLDAVLNTPELAEDEA